MRWCRRAWPEVTVVLGGPELRGEVLATGRAIGSKIGQGKVRVIQPADSKRCGGPASPPRKRGGERFRDSNHIQDLHSQAPSFMNKAG